VAEGPLVTLLQRLGRLGSDLGSFVKGIRAKDFYPSEELIAAVSVSQSRWHLLAPLVIVAAVGVNWILLPADPGTDRLGLFYGMGSIVLMSATLLLASRLPLIDRLFGGFDRVYIWHRCFGIAAIVFLLLHANAENEVANAVFPFGEDAEETGTGLAETAQNFFLVLIVISILRVLPYRTWRYSHLLLIVPFTFSAIHVATAEQPFALGSPGSLWLWAWSGIGFLSFFYRVLIVDSGLLDVRATVVRVEHTADAVAVTIQRNDKKPWKSLRPGQFVFIRDALPWHERHPFTVVHDDSDASHLTVIIKEVGDWTMRVAPKLHEGMRVAVSRPLGHLSVVTQGQQDVWIAGGSGVTPFLFSEEQIQRMDIPPRMLYFYRGTETAIALTTLRRWNEAGLLDLTEVDTYGGRPNAKKIIGEHINPGDHVVVCGPRSLVVDTIRQVRRNKAESLAFELYDYRSPYGPNLNPVIAAIVRFLLPSAWLKGGRWLIEEQPDKTPSPAAQ
jgi:predicted ferric reductase